MKQKQQGWKTKEEQVWEQVNVSGNDSMEKGILGLWLKVMAKKISLQVNQ